MGFETKLEAVNASRYVNGQPLLSDICLTLGAGERLAMVGPSGSGKTLLLRALAMLDPLDSGEIRWQGERVEGGRTPSFRSQVTYLHQRPALFEGTVDENLRRPFSLGVHREKKFCRESMIEQLNSLGRTDAFLDKQQASLSGGEAQLTSLLRAMQLDPQILLLDEPTSALDADATRQVESLVSRWLDRAKHRACIWVTHDPTQAERVADSVRHLEAGLLLGAN
jgi:putative ABC transport system ATP-binding protein